MPLTRMPLRPCSTARQAANRTALLWAVRRADPSRDPEDYRTDVLWAASPAPIAPDTRAALCAGPDLHAVAAATLRAVVDRDVPGGCDDPTR